MAGAAQQVWGVIIKPVQALHAGPFGEPPVDEVRLPHLVWLRHLKPRVGASWPFPWLRGDQAGLVQDPPDRGGRRRSQTFAFELPTDRFRAGIESIRGELRSQLDHAPTHLNRG